MTFLDFYFPFFSRILCLIAGNVRQACSSSGKTAERINETATLTRPTGLLNSDFRREICIYGAQAPPREILWSDGMASGRRVWSFGVKFVETVIATWSDRLCEMESHDSSANTWRRLGNNKTRHAGRKAVKESLTAIGARN